MRAPERVRRPDVGDAISNDEHADATAYLRIAHFSAATRTRGAGAGDDLGRVQEKKAHW